MATVKKNNDVYSNSGFNDTKGVKSNPRRDDSRDELDGFGENGLKTLNIKFAFLVCLTMLCTSLAIALIAKSTCPVSVFPTAIIKDVDILTSTKRERIERAKVKKEEFLSVFKGAFGNQWQKLEEYESNYDTETVVAMEGGTPDYQQKEIEKFQNDDYTQDTAISAIKEGLLIMDGTDCSAIASNNLLTNKENAKGVYEIFVEMQQLNVYCDTITDEGGWTVIQRRMNGSVDFNRNYIDYIQGFGNLEGEFWIGLENMYKILRGRDFELRIDMQDWSGNKSFAKYSRFTIGSPTEEYILQVSGYSGTSGDCLSSHSGVGFTAKDHDVHTYTGNYKGGWWHSNCHDSNLNGLYHRGGSHPSYADGVHWGCWKGHHYSRKFSEMKIRPRTV